MRFLALLFLLPLTVLAQGPVAFIPFMMEEPTTDWAQRVVANGGAMPSANTITAMETLRTTLISMNLTNKIHSLCIFVPDSIIAATTPLIKHKGADPWTNSGFVIGDLNINGLKGDGSSKFLDTAIKAKDGEAYGTSENCGLSVVLTEGATNRTETVIGYMDPDSTQDALELQVSSTQASGAFADVWFPGLTVGALNFISTNDWERIGFVHGARDTNGNVSLYVASPLEAHKSLVNMTSGTGAALTTDNTIPVFVRRRGGTNQSDTFSISRLAMACLDTGMIASESSNLWFAVNACRQSLGGGTGEPVHYYNLKIVNAGGAAISSTTSNALRTFYTGLDTDVLLYKMIVVNPYVPDNLTAVRTPLIWQAGSQYWTNNNFGSTNLSVNGLAGNTTSKSLGVGINISTLTTRGFSSTSAGATRMVSIILSNNSTHALGTFGTAASSIFTVNNYSGVVQFYAWKSVNINQNFLSWNVPYTNFASYLSGNRTAANAIALYVGTNGTHYLATNATGAQTGDTSTMTNFVTHAISGSSGIQLWSPDTISFIAVHSGLTQTESSNLYNRVHTMRTAMGGGSP
jgi:hypothetical protein